jgi:hypothetical protein
LHRFRQWIVRTPGGAFFGESLGENEVEGWGGERARCFELADRHGKAGRWVLPPARPRTFIGRRSCAQLAFARGPRLRKAGAVRIGR